ncbi:2-polyprenyl-6-methoxyphenol hydroxylase-like FAD-dependent oxidoreductase [Saccharothrix tamanrassetensis]|uniref:2-polyprenyl-6-methoxyphenol hydroxylase-like FAD-dependent oxidoreductase n=1 Tax=Saccharothrix tamanrassetensis TaxID=1051531 RepID=A0A841CJB6_9PSEU|nr:styrene monooxygenase/indole monooxygenase family protein [Saccharothrix tamanrassetensis]MBB5957551.1 2-polyprenyl-6-methoxyphenol hydroxylase-like FAD-dependent oxidoreductase [Saccharothrix tamanrassetensis]
MRSVAVVGAGQAGIVLSAALLRAGWRVTLCSDLTADQYLDSGGRPTACLFGDQIDYEASLGLDLWPDAPRSGRIRLDVHTDDRLSAFSVDAPLRKPALAVDQRLKFARGLREVAGRGAEVVTGSVTSGDLDSLAASHDLVVVTVGHKDLHGLFARDATRSVHTSAQRELFMVNVHGYDLAAHPRHRDILFTFVPGTVEVFWIPFWDKDVGESRSVVVEAVPGGRADRFGAVSSAAEGLDVLRELVAELLPGQSSFLAPVRPTSPVTWLKGSVVPVVREPVAVLPSGRHVLGLGDAVVLNDPLAGQGANNATRMVRFFASRLDDYDGTASWLRDRFDEFWEFGRYTNDFTNGLLAPLTGYRQDVLLAAAHDQSIGEELWEGFNDPSAIFPWFFDAAAAREFLAQRGVRRWDLLRYRLEVARKLYGRRVFRRPSPS